MPRNITLTFDDGSSHVYQNAPDDITPDQIEERATKEFSGKKITGLDGGKKAAAPKPAPAPEKESTFGERLGAEWGNIKKGAGAVIDSLTRPVQPGEYGSGWKDEAKQYYDQGAPKQFFAPGSSNPLTTGVKTALGGLGGMGEAPLAMGSGLASSAAGAVVGGVHGLATGDASTGVNTALNIAEHGTYQPRTEMGRFTTNMLGVPTALAKEVGGAVGGSIGRVAGNENLGQTLGEAGGELAGAASGARKLPAAIKESFATKKIIPMAQKDAATARTIDDGYGVMPTKGRDTWVQSGITSVAKEPKVKNTLILKNQENTNKLAKQDLKLEDSQHLDEATFVGQRAPHYAAYERLKNLDIKFKPDEELLAKVNGLSDKTLNIQESYPEFRASTDVSRAQNLVTKSAPEVSARATVELVKQLREDARHDLSRREITSSEKNAAHAKMDVATALEDMMDRGIRNHIRNLETTTLEPIPPGLKNMVQDLRTARKEIAKSHNVQEATNLETGNVDAAKLAALRAKGTPLTGNLKKIANARKVAPDVVRNTDGVVPSPEFSVGDIGMAAVGGLLSHGPIGVVSGAAAAAAARPTARALVTSRGYQNRIVKPKNSTTREGLGANAIGGEAALSMGAAAPQNTPWRKQDESSDR